MEQCDTTVEHYEITLQHGHSTVENSDNILEVCHTTVHQIDRQVEHCYTTVEHCDTTMITVTEYGSTVTSQCSTVKPQ